MNEAKLALLERCAREGTLATAIAEDGSLGEEIIRNVRESASMTNVATRYTRAYGYLRSAVDGALDLLTRGVTTLECGAYDRLKDAVERIDEELNQ